mmetsp:Transcript_35458/g.101236  ORF Transcript_35458/g.101236 Transcript_35458/m.101236 type:complete len:292 (+) Transcript_35458:41-916(+)|eukprot:CAMPEP_0168364022 /NCGR_PEP_ID=MMETSP0228-20121227/3993_1 /TAXON_ID=133427 /ORGANISM="Protoceratium reticulatum, Strain CCCM 535 (=CCMP 1889)" /LENGTH=291 /DNA_ID=CAMNT_0008376769 /DNA_START=27 /DNA_END=902 /DNA_ORIENTATION=-
MPIIQPGFVLQHHTISAFFGMFSAFLFSSIILTTDSERLEDALQTSCKLFECSPEVAVKLKGEQLDGPPEHCLPMPSSEEVKSCSSDEALRHYLKMATATQQRLVELMSLMAKLGKVAGTSDPGVKTQDSASRKLSDELDGHVRLFDDLARVGVLVDSVDDARQLEKIFDENVTNYHGFSIIRKLDRLGPDIVYPGGWRMLSYNLLDVSNGIIAEFQITLCPLKVMSTAVGHKIYEEIRTLKDRVYKRFGARDDVVDFEMDDLDKISHYAYKKASQVSCKGFAEEMLNSGE